MKFFSFFFLLSKNGSSRNFSKKFTFDFNRKRDERIFSEFPMLCVLVETEKDKELIKHPRSNISNPSCFSKSKQRVISSRLLHRHLNFPSAKKGLIKETLILSSAWNLPIYSAQSTIYWNKLTSFLSSPMKSKETKVK
jgi:hypothetical protein